MKWYFGSEAYRKLSMNEFHEIDFFTDDAPEALKALKQFIFQSALEEYPSVNELKTLLARTMEAIQDSECSLYFILDEAHHEVTSNALFPGDLDAILNDLMDRLNDVDPILRVTHNPSDQWSVIQKLDGSGILEAIAYIASPNIAEQFIHYISTTELKA